MYRVSCLMNATQLAHQLFFLPKAKVFALLDGASIPLLLKQLAQQQPDYECLYRGELAPDLAQAAPYLIRIEADSELLTWLASGFGQHWGIFVVAHSNLRTLRQHFRPWLTLQDAQGQVFYFRFYDPRVFKVYLPTCTPEEKKHFFGPVHCYLVEDPEKDSLLSFWPSGVQ